ncbi:type IIL restriction-modification enzyme MmeI [Methanosphaera cuniculi]|uniref:type IIL restriction-modification enzyme MmeI n=1 Tax=Methanosphaera cuniculi TaxID=1077256 RepID=UPI00349F12E8
MFYYIIYISDKKSRTINNLGQRINTLFEILDEKEDERQTNLSDELKNFPYVNGSFI